MLLIVDLDGSTQDHMQENNPTHIQKKKSFSKLSLTSCYYDCNENAQIF